MRPLSVPDALERRLIIRALRAHRGNATAAARSLRMSRSTLYYRADIYGIADLIGRRRWANAVRHANQIPQFEKPKQMEDI